MDIKVYIQWLLTVIVLYLFSVDKTTAQNWKRITEKTSVGNYLRSQPKNQGSPKDKYTVGEKFNPGGYRLSSGRNYRDVYLKCFPDNDTLFCLQYPDERSNGRKFHFLIINNQLKDYILENGLSKKYNMVDRRMWVKEFLESTDIRNINNSNSPWTKCTTISDGSVVYGNYYQAGFVPLTYEKAVRAYKDQRNITADDILMGLIIYNWMTKPKDEKKVYLDGDAFPDEVSRDSYKNAIGK